MILVGIDYSINSPAICIGSEKAKSPKDCFFFYVKQKRKNLPPNSRFCPFEKAEWSCSAERFYANWNFAKSSLETAGLNKIDHIWMEGYSYGSRGAIFDLAENVGFLRAGLWDYKLQALPIAPPTIKKFGAGTGKADKNQMYEAWLKEGGYPLAKEWDVKPDSNPVSDIVDSYFVMKTGISKLK